MDSDALVASLTEAVPLAQIERAASVDRHTTIYVSRDDAPAILRAMRERPDLAFTFLAELTAVDVWPKEPRFEVIYQLHSIEKNQRLRLKCLLSGVTSPDLPEIDSVTGVWRGANWYEREVFDMFGIGFRNHPNLVRILMPTDWEGYPLRKDYPVHGYKYSYPSE